MENSLNTSHLTAAAARRPPPAAMEWYTVTLPATQEGEGDDNCVIILSGVRLCPNRDDRLVVVAVDRTLQAHEHALQDLRVGMEILQVNNVDTPLLNIKEEDEDPMSSTRTRLTGLEYSKLLTLTVRLPTASTHSFITTAIYKPTVDTKVGIGFWQSDPEVDTGYVLIDQMVPTSVTAAVSPLLKPGMRILSVNNRLAFHCKETADQVRNAQGLITLLAQTPQETRPLYDPVVATFPLFVFDSSKTNNRDTDLGLQVEQIDGKIVITQLSRVFASIKNELRVGMQLLSINNVAVETPRMAHALLTGACACAPRNDVDADKSQNVVTLLAQHILQPPPGTLVSLSVVKPTTETKLGLVQGMQMPPSLDRLPKDYTKEEGHVVIRRVTEGGLIAKTAAQHTSTDASTTILQPGMILHQITLQNQVYPLKGLHNKQVSELLRMAGQGCTVTFLAEVPTTTAPTGTLYPITSLPPYIFDTLDTVALTKKLPDQSLGMTLAKGPNTPQIMVIGVEEGGLAAKAGLKVGMQILQVNNSTVKDVLDVVTRIGNVGAGIPVTLLVQKDAASFIPPVVTGSVFKETKGSKVGIKLRKYKGASAIVSIKEDSISSSTDLLGGLLIQSINNVQGERVHDTEQAANMLIDGQGDITILAVTPEMGLVDDTPFVTATVLLTKQMELQEDVFSFAEAKVWVTEAGMKGLFQGTPLRVGMQVVALNNMDCSLLPKPEGVMSLLQTASDDRCVVTVLAKQAALPPPKQLVTATVFKETPESKIGLTYVVDGTKKKTILTRIDDGSLAAATKLMPGMELLTIANTPVQGLNREGVAKLFASSSGLVHMVAVPHDGRSAPDQRILICATLDKTPGGPPVGIKVIREHYNRMVVSEIEEGSLAASSDILPGMVLHLIDNVPCQNRSTVGIEAKLNNQTTGPITILAEASPRGKLVTATLFKESEDTKLGVTMVQRQGRVLIKKIVPDSLTDKSVLDLGMWIKAINNKDVHQDSVIRVATLLCKEMPLVTVLAETTTETFDEEEEEETKETAEEESAKEEEENKEGEEDNGDKEEEVKEGENTEEKEAAQDEEAEAEPEGETAASTEEAGKVDAHED